MGLDPEKKFVAKWWFWIVLLMVLTVPISFGMKALGLWGHTVVERKVFENSYQYDQARRTAVATYEAQLVEISAKLRNPDLDPMVRSDLEALAASLRVRVVAEMNR